MLRAIGALLIVATLPVAGLAQTSSQQALARAEALDACAGRPVLSAEVVDGNRLNVTCGEDGDSLSTDAGQGLSSGTGIAILGGFLVLLGAAGAGGGGGGSAGGTN